ncbi:serine/threonine-protein kinase [Nonomuraea sp. MCN248]|uniref:Serine/threonine-protein kinase n=1 Tax=Nonomuraea corallina TaxID=2989783 RepID=A0ABT4SBG3_9ACTN|nr:serine/threonine-protein kinase [Nonomuraea corallina]MDA0634271.1 serine/threonine-protein kinase [Nonomuraea corallina]
MTPQGRRIGPYTLIRTLGQGGMGTVYLAYDAGFTTVALKVLHAELAGREDFRRRFDREAEAARRVARFCTAPVLDAGFDGGTAYLVTEYVDGPDLSSVIDAQGPMTGANLEALAVGVATALAAIHQAGVVHRDLKPSNILLSAVGPRVIDFGIAQLADPDATRSATISGTPAYMAPEQAGGLPTTPASDVFAWGGVIAYAGTGRPPFGTGAVPEVLYRVVHHVPTLDGLDERLRPLVEQALHKDPARRPTVQELLDRLLGRPSATVATATQMVSDSWSPPPGAPPAPRPRRLLAPVAAAALAAAVTLASTLAIWRPWTSPPSGTTRTITAPATPPASGGPSQAAVTPGQTPTGVVTPGAGGAELSFTHTNAWNEKVRARVRIDSLRRQGADVKLEWTVTNDAGAESISLYQFHTTRFLGDTNASSIQLVARDEPLPWKPMAQDGTCACTSWGAGDTIAAGESMRFFAVFRRVPETVRTVDVDLLRVGVLRNVLITAK